MLGRLLVVLSCAQLLGSSGCRSAAPVGACFGKQTESIEHREPQPRTTSDPGDQDVATPAVRLSDPTRVDMYLGSERPRESLRVNVEVDWLDLLRGLGAEGGTVQRFAGGALIDLRKLGERELALGSAVLAVVVGSALRQGATVEVRPDVLLVLFPAGRDEFARGW